MRAPYNHRIDLYYGPEGSNPGGLKASDIPCRIVVDICFIDMELPLLESLAYVTLDEVLPTGASWFETGEGKYNVNFQVADRVALAVGLPPSLVVYRVESRNWDTGAPYFRAHLGPDFDVPEVGCESYQLSPWGILISRTGPTTWGDVDTIMTTDGAGNWDILDVGDDIHYFVSDWDGEGTATLWSLQDPPQSVDAICQE